jgi:DNA-binding Xre family transcriptional regulator
MENGMTIKSRLKEIMKSKGVTMAQLANDAGVAIETIRRARGDGIRLCRLGTLRAIAEALSVGIMDLFDEQ